MTSKTEEIFILLGLLHTQFQAKIFTIRPFAEILATSLGQSNNEAPGGFSPPSAQSSDGLKLVTCQTEVKT